MRKERRGETNPMFERGKNPFFRARMEKEKREQWATSRKSLKNLERIRPMKDGFDLVDRSFIFYSQIVVERNHLDRSWGKIFGGKEGNISFFCTHLLSGTRQVSSTVNCVEIQCFLKVYFEYNRLHGIVGLLRYKKKSQVESSTTSSFHPTLQNGKKKFSSLFCSTTPYTFFSERDRASPKETHLGSLLSASPQLLSDLPWEAKE